MKKLNLASGQDRKDGYINIDIRKECNPDVLHDLNKFPYPFKDHQFDEILAYNILEHLDKPANVILELKRILRAGGILKIRVPYYRNKGAFSDIGHIHFFTEDTFHKEFDGELRILKHELGCEGRLRKYLPFKNLFNKVFFGVYDYIYVEITK